MANTFFISDPHFGHEKTCTVFKRVDGTPLRPFSSSEEMDEEMVKRWNEVVGRDDKVYVLGDVVIRKPAQLEILNRLKGNKRLVRGNHDIFDTKHYLPHFKHIYGVRVLDDIVLSHVPLHPESITQRWNCNVHGHLHANIVTKKQLVNTNPGAGALVFDEIEVPDTLYFNVSVEQIDYRPIEYSELLDRIKKMRDTYGYPDFGKYVHRKDSAD